MKSGQDVWHKLSAKEIDYHISQYEEPYRSTVHAIEFLKKSADISEDSKLKVLDLGTGAGANLYWLAKAFPSCHFIGIDINEELIELGKENTKAQNNIELICGDFELTKSLPGIDYILSFQVLSWLPFEGAMNFLDLNFSAAKRGVFLTSLFCEANIDYDIRVHDHSSNVQSQYNVYALQTVKAVGEKNGFGLKHFEDFNIDIDLNRPTDGRGTYTLKMYDDRRLQFSGCMHMPWYFILFHRLSN